MNIKISLFVPYYWIDKTAFTSPLLYKRGQKFHFSILRCNLYRSGVFLFYSCYNRFYPHKLAVLFLFVEKGNLGR